MKRELVEAVKPQQYFERVPAPAVQTDEGTRDMEVLAPFLISGGTNTERYYFTHINDTTDYKFNIRPRYFAGESNYTTEFTNRIREILKNNADAKIYCVFDWDTIFNDAIKIEKHKTFERRFQTEIDNGRVVICPTMPCIEYWFLLHFVNTTKLMKTYSEVANVLSPYIKDCFSEEAQGVTMKKLLKKEEYLKPADWVKRLCADGKLEAAIRRAEENITKAEDEGGLNNQSYSYVYRLFRDR